MYQEFWESRLLNTKIISGRVNGNCPICDDTEQQFYANISTGSWDCKKCQSTGNAITYLKIYKRINNQAIAKCFKEYGITDQIIPSENNKYWDKTEKGNLRPTFNNVRNLFETDNNLIGLVGLNTFKGDVEIIRKPEWRGYEPVPRNLDDGDLIDIKEYLRKLKIEPTTSIINDAVVATARLNSYNPVKDYLRNLKWDGKKRLETWLIDYCGAEDNRYSRFIGQMTLVAACARVDKPGIKYDYMLILEGKQGICKSQAIQVLGGQWFGEISLVDRDKDTIGKMRGCWFIEVPELDGLRKREIDSLKAFITTATDRSRLPYDRREKDFPRKSIFIGTINPESVGYLKDKTRNRRFLPIAVKNIKLSELKRDRDMLFAEAYLQYRAGSPLYITDTEILSMAKKEQEKREIYDDWQDVIVPWLKEQANKGNNYVTNKDIYVDAIGGNVKDFHSGVARRLSAILEKIGLKKGIKRINGVLTRGFDLDKWSFENVTDDFEDSDDISASVEKL